MDFQKRQACRLLCAAMLLAAAPLCAQQAPAHSSSKSAPAAKVGSRAQGAIPEGGPVSDGVYRNAFFGITYKIPFGWVERTRQMREDSGDPSKSLLLLSVFERPPEAAGDTVNSAVVITAESVSLYPGLKNAEDYFAQLSQLTTGKGFKAVNEPYEFAVSAKRLVRGDFSKEMGKLTMCQASLVTVQKGYVVSFTFIGGSQDEVEELVEKLSFGAAGKPGAAPPFSRSSCPVS